jgi:hypothetical protein
MDGSSDVSPASTSDNFFPNPSPWMVSENRAGLPALEIISFSISVFMDAHAE